MTRNLPTLVPESQKKSSTVVESRHFKVSSRLRGRTGLFGDHLGSHGSRRLLLIQRHSS